MTTTETYRQTIKTYETDCDRVAETEVEAHTPHLAHHFETLDQQYNASKLGMWLFLATEVLLFGGLFCLYAVFRGNEPAMFAYGSNYLNTMLGATNTAVLILSSLTMAVAVTAAQRNQKWLLVTLLGLTFLGGAGFMGIKYVEYSHKFHDNLVWGTQFYEGTPHEAKAEHEAGFVTDDASEQAFTPDAAKGKELWMATCRSCHGVEGEGIEGQGKDIRQSEFIAERSDEELVEFIQKGRMPFHPDNETGIQMPPRGGNPQLSDDDLRHIVAYVREFHTPPGEAPAEHDTTTTAASESGDKRAQEQAFWIPKSSMPDAAAAPRNITDPRLIDQPGNMPGTKQTKSHPVNDPRRPQSMHLFFGIYFLMTGLHGLHVLVGMLVIGWLAVRAALGHFSSAYYTPIDLGGLYWHVVDLIWIFLFPLFYLIG